METVAGGSLMLAYSDTIIAFTQYMAIHALSVDFWLWFKMSSSLHFANMVDFETFICTPIYELELESYALCFVDLCYTL